MSYTPVELRHVKVGRSLFGYNRATVEQLIEEVAQSFEATWRERGELADKVETLEKHVAELRGREHLLTQTLVAAEQAASDVRERARREAEVIVQEAHNEARAIGRSAQSERERLFVESKRIEGMLRAALGIIESQTAPASAAVPAPVPVPVPVAAPVVAPEPEPEPEPELIHEPEPEPVHEQEPVAAMPWPAIPVPAAPVHLREPEPNAESEYGWAREDTREFEPISFEPETQPAPEPEHHAVATADPVEEPVLERIPGAGSRDFDWGE
jgi:cell division initiation protein